MELCRIQEKEYSYVEAMSEEDFPPNERPPCLMLMKKAK